MLPLPVRSGLFVRELIRTQPPSGTLAQEYQNRKEEAGFRSGRGSIDHTFKLTQLLEQRYGYGRPTIALFLDFKGAFD